MCQRSDLRRQAGGQISQGAGGDCRCQTCVLSLSSLSVVNFSASARYRLAAAASHGGHPAATHDLRSSTRQMQRRPRRIGSGQRPLDNSFHQKARETPHRAAACAASSASGSGTVMAREGSDIERTSCPFRHPFNRDHNVSRPRPSSTLRIIIIPAALNASKSRPSDENCPA
jgi:hypothetical protein